MTGDVTSGKDTVSALGREECRASRSRTGCVLLARGQTGQAERSDAEWALSLRRVGRQRRRRGERLWRRERHRRRARRRESGRVMKERREKGGLHTRVVTRESAASPMVCGR
ncbi:hypothetical protein L226DRAFT_143876 [Lentinus tigrinus ALCF2SS1-7]|uniref:uncharacterized protein n=1 Tax=Lentinus tigrinus ALCF2SS1-7 TaxID=1328758 RepID=UPI0011662528|nr:hypothetical protein L226DRAFT_143876 [Lentinus tigrinus ALCF2SS1-7]